MTPPQSAYFSEALDIMLEAGICAHIAAKDVKCISPITLVAKAHSTARMTMDELHKKVNSECEQVDVLSLFIGLHATQPTSEVQEASSGIMQPQKWRVCTNYCKLNKVMQVLPMPQGNI